jgi:hypothetical protein
VYPAVPEEEAGRADLHPVQKLPKVNTHPSRRTDAYGGKTVVRNERDEEAEMEALDEELRQSTMNTLKKRTIVAAIRSKEVAATGEELPTMLGGSSDGERIQRDFKILPAMLRGVQPRQQVSRRFQSVGLEKEPVVGTKARARSVVCDLNLVITRTFCLQPLQHPPFGCCCGEDSALCSTAHVGILLHASLKEKMMVITLKVPGETQQRALIGFSRSCNGVQSPRIFQEFVGNNAGQAWYQAPHRKRLSCFFTQNPRH